MSLINMSPSYANDLVARRSHIIRAAREDLDGINFDTIVGTGLSGGLIVPHIADRLGVNWFIVRKTNDGSHDSNPGVGILGKRWIFVDDLISTGATFRACRRGVAAAWIDSALLDPEFDGPALVGAWSYSLAMATRDYPEMSCDAAFQLTYGPWPADESCPSGNALVEAARAKAARAAIGRPRVTVRTANVAWEDPGLRRATNPGRVQDAIDATLAQTLPSGYTTESPVLTAATQAL